MTARPKIRCAVYTRKSTDEGLDQAFNSLDAQYEACVAYVASQKHEGWALVRTRYDDGGVSGGTLKRPALEALLAEVDAGRVGMIVVYKIDRLTRSLADFAKLVERLDAAGCSFVSVTQAFNTATSMGRLTLNVLLSFAQFEREVTAERIRDKIAASKKKGFWMGGNTPLGYDPHPDPERRTLVENASEAQTVRTLFGLYDRHRSLGAVRRQADRFGLRSKARRTKSGETIGGACFSNGQIQHILRNPVYIGQIRHKDRSWPGLHPPLIDEDLWLRVQSALGRARTCRSQGSGNGALLTGKLWDETGDRLTPTHTTRSGRRHRYYVSNRLIAGGPDTSGWRLPAGPLERVISDAIADHLETAARAHTVLQTIDARRSDETAQTVAQYCRDPRDRMDLVADVLASGEILSGRVRLCLDKVILAKVLRLNTADIAPDILTFDVPFSLRRRGAEMKIVAASTAPRPDPTLVRTLRDAYRWAKALRSGQGVAEIARTSGHSEAFIRTRTQLAFLSPRLQAAILDGTHPADLTVKRILRRPVPLNWAAQEQLYGHATS
ncbi:MAG: recombinase family protein [Pseudomonadota bacterium]